MRIVYSVMNPIFLALWMRHATGGGIQIANYNLKDKTQGAWHHDIDSSISVVVPLNTEDYEGGGTEFYSRGVLEPLQASPVIIEDNAFIGSRCIIVEGARVGKEAVLGANVVITKSTKVIDVTQSEPVEYRGEVPERKVVIPGSYSKKFNSGDYHVPCALIIGERKESTDLKTSLNEVLREFEVTV